MTLKSLSLLIGAVFCAVAAVLMPSGFNVATAASSDAPIKTNPIALGKHLSAHPNKLSIVLVSTPGCGLCKLVRERQLAPLLKDPNHTDVAVFEVLMRDATPFAKPLKNFRDHTGADLGEVSSAAQLSEKLDINVAPTVLFIADSREVAQRLIGYSVPEYYFAYLSEQIDVARQSLTTHQQN